MLGPRAQPKPQAQLTLQPCSPAALHNDRHWALARSFTCHHQHFKGLEQQQEPRAGGGTPLCQITGPGPILKVTYITMFSMSSMMCNTPMCESTLMPTLRPNLWSSTWLSTPMALSLPPTVTAPVRGGIRQGCAFDKRMISHDVTQLPVFTDRGPPQTSAAELRALNVCPLANEH